MGLIVTGWAVFFYIVSPSIVVQTIGIQNAYAVVFVLGVICGFSSLTTSTFYIAIAALSNGGAQPLLLGLSGGLGLCISDAAFYLFIRKGTSIVVDTRWLRVSQSIARWIHLMPDWILFPSIFLYSTFAPIPNDIILAALAVAGTPLKRIAPWLFLGDIASALLLAYLTH
jgi:hypothetical protein